MTETFEEFKQRNPHLNEFFPYLDQLNRESDRGKVLISTGFMEEQLRKVLLAYLIQAPEADELVSGANAPLGTFSSRINACYLLGLISEVEHHDLNVIRKIRNDFAHSISTGFDTQSVIDRCKNLKLRAAIDPMGNQVPIPPVAQFMTAAVAIILRLVNRPQYVSKQRSSYGNWPEQ